MSKVVLITGASRGIGKAIALKFAEKGAKVIVNYVNSKKEAEEVVKKIEEIGSEAIAIKCDVSKEDEVKKMVKESVDKFGKIDVLVNNAGIVFDVPFKDKTVDQWKRTLDVNFLGTFLCTKYVIEEMSKQKSGNIINISSTNGIDTYNSESVDYDASKAGVNILTKCLAKELAPNIRINCVAPGWIDTDINKDLPKDYIEEEKKRICLKRFGKPEEIANVVLFLASDESSFMTGSIVVVDGGYD